MMQRSVPSILGRRLGAVRAHLTAPNLATGVPAPTGKFRADYLPPPFRVSSVHLEFSLGVGEAPTRVLCRLQVQRQAAADEDSVLQLEGEDLQLCAVTLNGEALSATEYSADAEFLTVGSTALPQGDAEFTLETEVEISPLTNFQLSGLYKSSGMFCTQCEAEGFRRIAYNMDRPDVMAKYTVRITADEAENPVLLSNGNLIGQGKLPGGRHFTEWHDPWPKPSYLFALVAGNLGVLEDSFTTMSGRKVALRIFSEHDKIAQCHHSMLALKQSMKWDEEVYGLEYDLDLFNIVAVSDFNMGAMENKSLNIFNTSAVLASPEVSTDDQMERVAGIVAHEYFHNYTGNRITCRDWFQLTLKEGLTVYRDQQFSADMTSAAVKRIEEVRGLRAAQFPEDAGPTAHPIRPEHYIAMDNFYTATVYEKGAQVIRMYETLLGGQAAFQKGMKLYFERHDGDAVTCDDFRAAMADANGVADGLAQFEEWYKQAGTPEVVATPSYDSSTGIYTLQLQQSCAPSPGQPTKCPFHIPVAVGLIDRTSGKDLLPGTGGTQVLELREEQATFRWELGAGYGAVPPVLSLLRDFSAPVRASTVPAQSADELAFLMSNDSDSFVRWDSAQQLATQVILSLVETVQSGDGELQVDPRFVEAARGTLAQRNDAGVDPSLLAYTLSLPTEGMIADVLPAGSIDPTAIHVAREFLLAEISRQLRSELLATLRENSASVAGRSYDGSQDAVGARRLANMALRLLCVEGLGDAEALAMAQAQFESADNMTDEAAAFDCLLAGGTAEQRLGAIAQFEAKWSTDALVMDSWFSSQARSAQQVNSVRELMAHPLWSLTNPNKMRSLVSGFCQGNLAEFHKADGSGYDFLADVVTELDQQNPQMAARTTTGLRTWRRLEPRRQAMAEQALRRIAAKQGLSNDTLEVVSKLLAAPVAVGAEAQVAVAVAA